jgi:hypothetical protein
MRPVEKLIGFETSRKVRNLYSKFCIPVLVSNMRVISVSVVIVVSVSIVIIIKAVK